MNYQWDFDFNDLQIEISVQKSKSDQLKVSINENLKIVIENNPKSLKKFPSTSVHLIGSISWFFNKKKLMLWYENILKNGFHFNWLKNKISDACWPTLIMLNNINWSVCAYCSLWWKYLPSCCRTNVTKVESVKDEDFIALCIFTYGFYF